MSVTNEENGGRFCIGAGNVVSNTNPTVLFTANQYSPLILCGGGNSSAPIHAYSNSAP